MMHLHLWAVAVAVAVLIRVWGQSSEGQSAESQSSQRYWQRRWHRALLTFLAPPLLLLTTAIAVLAMGYSTAHPWDGQLSYAIALSVWLTTLAISLRLCWMAFRTWQEIRTCPQRLIQVGPRTARRQKLGRVLDVPLVFSAQVGLWPSLLWSSELVVSQGLLDHLDDEHLAAVMAHEAGHDYYRDTFWFFGLGGLRQLTSWLPYSEALWQELLMLREVRADQWAARQVDALVLAESLMSVITAPLMSESVCAGFSCAAPRSRLAERIDALLDLKDPSPAAAACEASPAATHSFKFSPWQWAAIACTLAPLLAIPAHG